MNGHIVSVTREYRGDTLTATTPIGGTILTVADAVDFDPDGGWLTLPDGTSAQYAAADLEANTLTLVSPLVAAADADENIRVWDPDAGDTGEAVTDFVATVDIGEAGTLYALLTQSLIDKLDEGMTAFDGVSVSVTRDNDGTWWVDNILGRVPTIRGTFFDTATFPGITAATHAAAVAQIEADLAAIPPLIAASAVPNAGFEQATGNNGIDPHQMGPAVASGARQSTLKRSGGWAGRLVLNTYTGSGIDLALTIGGIAGDVGTMMPTRAGEAVYAEAWVRHDSPVAAFNVHMMVFEYAADGTFLTFGYTPAVVTSPAMQKTSMVWTAASPACAYTAAVIGVGAQSAGDALIVDDLTFARKLTGDLLVDGAVRAWHFAADSFTGVTMTAALFQTNAAADRGLKIVSAANGGYGSLITYDVAGAPTLTIDGQTGAITMVGDLTSGSSVIGAVVATAATGPRAMLWTASNAFESGESWSMLQFYPGISGWSPAQVWAVDDNVDEAALRISGPHNPAASGSDPYRKTAVLDLRGFDTGDSIATLYANTVQFEGDSFNLASTAGAFDMNLFDTNVLQIQQGAGDGRLTLDFSTAGVTLLRARNVGAGTSQGFNLDGSAIKFVVTGVASTEMAAGSAGPIWTRSDAASGITLNSNGEVQVRGVTGTYGAIRASSFPTSSDLHWKQAVHPLTPFVALDTVRGLSPADWLWQRTGSDRDGTPGRGFVAQHVQTYLPHAVTGTPIDADGNGDGLAVDAMPLLATLWASVQELDRRLTEATR